MKRLWITLAVVALAVIAALPATAKKPPKPPTTTTTTTAIPDFVDCSFDPVTGVLDSWHGHLDDERQCIWNVDHPGDTFRFQIQSDPDDPVATVKLPVLIVNDDIVFPSNKCFWARQNGPQPLDFPAEGDNLWTFSPEDHQCGDGPYLLTISIQGLRSGTVNLVMTQTPSTD